MYSFRKYPKLILFYIMFFSLLISQLSIAQEAIAQKTIAQKSIDQESIAQEIISHQGLQKKIVKVKSINKDGLVFDLQEVDPILLTKDVEKLREAYIQQQHKLVQQIENKKFTAGDTIISIIIPGGLFYAGYRKQELEKAKKELLAVTSEIEELSRDLIALKGQETTNPVMLALLP